MKYTAISVTLLTLSRCFTVFFLSLFSFLLSLFKFSCTKKRHVYNLRRISYTLGLLCNVLQFVGDMYW